MKSKRSKLVSFIDFHSNEYKEYIEQLRAKREEERKQLKKQNRLKKIEDARIRKINKRESEKRLKIERAQQDKINKRNERVNMKRQKEQAIKQMKEQARQERIRNRELKLENKRREREEIRNQKISSSRKNDFRNYNGDSKYKAARLAALKRDGYKCKMCNKKKCKLQVHHIKKWADYPTLRYSVENLITLCTHCHKKIWGKEELWEGYCLSLLVSKSIDLKYQLWKLRQKEKEGDEDNE